MKLFKIQIIGYCLFLVPMFWGKFQRYLYDRRMRLKGVKCSLLGVKLLKKDELFAVIIAGYILPNHYRSQVSFELEYSLNNTLCKVIHQETLRVEGFISEKERASVLDEKINDYISDLKNVGYIYANPQIPNRVSVQLEEPYTTVVWVTIILLLLLMGTCYFYVFSKM